MKRLVAAIFLALFCAAAVRPASGFSLLGQFKITANGYNYDWQVGALGYQLAGDIGGPMFPQEGYRWNVPTIYYTFDSSFINFFGSNGIYAVEQAIASFNSLGKMSKITNDNSRLYVDGQPVPYQTKRVNYSAQSLGLLDLKSTAMTVIIEELGLAEPERWCFAMYARFVPPAPPPITNYSVIPLNFDPISIDPTNSVNGTHYTYLVLDPIRNTYADAIELLVNPVEFPTTSVAGFFSANVLAIDTFQGAYFTGLSHDDVGGLRWLYSRNHMAVENLPSGTTIGALSPYDPVFPIIGTNAGATNVTITNLVAPTALRRGIDRFNFKRVNFDSLLGTTFHPFTNSWTDTIITNGQAFSIPVQRPVLAPDLLFTVRNIPSANEIPFEIVRTTTGAWTNNDAINGNSILGGPGNIYPQIEIGFSEVLPYFLNQNPDFRFQWSAPIITWGSFDGSTNPPVVYPQYGNLSLRDLNRLARQRPPTQPRRSKRKRRLTPADRIPESSL